MPVDISCIDLNNDGIVDISDIIKVLRIAQGLETSPDVCKITSTTQTNPLQLQTAQQ